MVVIGILLSAFVFLFSIQSTSFFLIKKETTIIEWLFFNPCAISSFLFIFGFVLFLLKESTTLLYASILPMFYFGTTSLIVLQWNKKTLFPQIHHVVMTISILWTINIVINDYNGLNDIILVLMIIAISAFIKLHEMYKRKNENVFIEKLMK